MRISGLILVYHAMVIILKSTPLKKMPPSCYLGLQNKINGKQVQNNTLPQKDGEKILNVTVHSIMYVLVQFFSLI